MSKSALFFDHTFTLDKGHRFHKKLEKLGFTLEKQQVEHPGKAFCRFIMFEAQHSRKASYLEFVDVRLKKHNHVKAGLSFGYSKGLKKFFGSLKKKLNCDFFHKNYHWKKDSVSDLPGWNFVSFKKTGIRAYFPWITEYEEKPGKKKSLKPPKHKNSVYKIMEINLKANAQGEQFYNKLLGTGPSKKKLACGTILNFSNSRNNGYESVVLACRSLQKFCKVTGLKQHFVYKGQEAVLIQNPGMGWDIIVLEP